MKTQGKAVNIDDKCPPTRRRRVVVLRRQRGFAPAAGLPEGVGNPTFLDRALPGDERSPASARMINDETQLHSRTWNHK